MLEQAKAGALVLQATQGKNPFSGKVKFMLPSGQEVARTDPGFLRSANHVEFQGRKYKYVTCVVAHALECRSVPVRQTLLLSVCLTDIESAHDVHD